MKIKMKRSLSLLLTVCFLLSALPFTIALDDVEPDDPVCTEEASPIEVPTPVVEQETPVVEKETPIVEQEASVAEKETPVDEQETPQKDDNPTESSVQTAFGDLGIEYSDSLSSDMEATIDPDALTEELSDTDSSNENDSSISIITAFAELPGDIAFQKYASGELSSIGEIIFPTTIHATDSDSNELSITVLEWVEMWGEEFDPDAELALYYYTPELPTQYDWQTNWLDLPMITVFIGEAGEQVCAVETSSTTPIDLNGITADTSGDGWKWDYYTKTLTLDGLELDVTGVAAIIMPNGVASTIVLIGDNTIKSNVIGIVAYGNLTIRGNGTFNITAVQEGIWSNESITIRNAAIKVNAVGDGIHATNDIEITTVAITVYTQSFGIFTQNGNITITGGTFDIEAGEQGIETRNGNVTITSGMFEITADDYGIWSGGNTTISNAAITLNTGNIGINSFNKNVEITDTELKIVSKTGGISAAGNVTITGGTFKIEVLGDGHGIAGADVTIRGSGIINVLHVDSEKFVVRATGTLTHPEMLVFGWDGTGYTVASSTVKLMLGYTFVDATTNTQLANIQFVPIPRTVTFDGNGGTPSEATRTVGHGLAIGTLPTASQIGYEFNGWFTAASGGIQISVSTTITGDITFYAQWTFIGGGDTGGGTGTDPDPDIESPDYTFSGGSSTFVQGSGQPLVLTIQKDFDLFDSVYVNNTALTQGTHYTATSGSTIITMLPAYLNTLSPGVYTVEVRFSDGDSVITTFTIEAVQQSTANNPPQVQSTTENRTGTGLPQTGVTSNTTLWAVLLTVSMFSAALVWYKLRKMKNPL